MAFNHSFLYFPVCSPDDLFILFLNFQFIGATIGSSNLNIQTENGHIGMPSNICCVIVEYCPGGALKSYLIKNRRKKLAFKVVVQLALDLARGSNFHSLLLFRLCHSYSWTLSCFPLLCFSLNIAKGTSICFSLQHMALLFHCLSYSHKFTGWAICIQRKLSTETLKQRICCWTRHGP